MEGTAVNTRKGDCPKWFIAGLISLAAQMIACGGSENRAEHDQERIADIGRVLPQEHTVDFNGFIFGRAWVL